MCDNRFSNMMEGAWRVGVAKRSGMRDKRVNTMSKFRTLPYVRHVLVKLGGADRIFGEERVGNERIFLISI